MALARSVVEAQCDFVAPSLAEVLHGAALGDVLSNEAVRVFVGAALPGVIRRGEVKEGAGGLLNVLVSVKLGSVVDSDRFEQVRVRSDQLNDAPVGGGHGTRGQLSEEHAAGRSFDESEHAVAIERTHDRVHFPVTNLVAAFDGRRTLGDVTLACEPTALLSTFVAFAPLRRLPEEAKELSSALLVAANEAINRFATDLESTFESKAAADLIRA